MVKYIPQFRVLKYVKYTTKEGQTYEHGSLHGDLLSEFTTDYINNNMIYEEIEELKEYNGIIKGVKIIKKEGVKNE